jgi:hypothetical protein
MKKLLFTFSVALGLMLLLSGCIGPEEIPEPKNLIDENNYVDLMVELQHLKTYQNAYPDSVNTDSIKAIIYDRFGVSEEQFLSSHAYYQKHTKEQIGRVNEVINRMEQEESYIQAHIDSVKSVRTKQPAEDSTLSN